MRGSISWQVTEVFKSVDSIGEKKHEAKEVARAEGARTFEEVGRAIGVHGLETMGDYKAIAERCFEHCKAEFGVKDVTRLEAYQIQSYLEKCIETGGRSGEGIERSTYNQYSSGLAKFETALNRYSEEKNLGRTYDFSLKEMKDMAALALGKAKDDSRAYKDPNAVVGAITGPKASHYARMYRESGARISELSKVNEGQLRGIKPDPSTGELKGWVEVSGKGGYKREVGMSVATYNRQVGLVSKGNGKASINQSYLRTKLEKAATKTGQVYTGAHGLRWNWAADRMNELQLRGISYEASLSIVSEGLGHHRSDISCRYLS